MCLVSFTFKRNENDKKIKGEILFLEDEGEKYY